MEKSHFRWTSFWGAGHYRCIGTRFLPKEVFSHLIVVTYVIHISQVNREIRLGFFHGCRNYSRFIRPCAPIAR
jgi:hypothetical protein